LLNGSGLVNEWEIIYTPQATKDGRKLAASNLDRKAELLVRVLASNPYQSPPPFEKLLGTTRTIYSRRINIKHRMVYEIIPNDRIVKILRMWTHYE